MRCSKCLGAGGAGATIFLLLGALRQLLLCVRRACVRLSTISFETSLVAMGLVAMGLVHAPAANGFRISRGRPGAAVAWLLAALLSCKSLDLIGRY